jgi:acetyl-CoA acyltransferase
MGDAVIVEAVRTPIGKGKPTGALAGIPPVDSIQPRRQTGARRGPDRPLPAATASSHPDNVVRSHAR